MSRCQRDADCTSPVPLLIVPEGIDPMACPDCGHLCCTRAPFEKFRVVKRDQRPAAKEAKRDG